MIKSNYSKQSSRGKSIKSKLVLLLASLIILANCSTKKEDSVASDETKLEVFKEGSFGYDLNFLEKHKEVVLLKSQDGQSQLVVCPAYQGRVMTSTANGMEGYSFGWLNHKLISSGEVLAQFNPIGGEERIWFGPEGGQFSLFFKPESSFDFDKWQVPREIDTEPFSITSKAQKEVVFEKAMKLKNYSGTTFDLNIQRTIKILEKEQAGANLAMSIPDDIKMVGFESENILTNKGTTSWDKNSGALSIWILSMLNPSPNTTIIVPFKKGEPSELGKIVTDDYFGKVPAERLIVKEEVLFFKADGKMRSKIGVSPSRAKPLMGSYDADNKVLTVVQFSLPQDQINYVNSMWEIQDKPFEGDAINAYNDGPLEDGSQMGPFYELESSSPAAFLPPGEGLVHFHRTYHFQGNNEVLEKLSTALFGLGLDEIMSVL